MWHHEGMVTKDDLAAAKKRHDAAVAEAERIRADADRERAKIFARAAGEGMPQKDIIEATGYSRETVRRITREGQEALHQKLECPECHATPRTGDTRIITASLTGTTTETWHTEGCPQA
jgi:1,6-anhydro-N-acetylmuramate kinase